MGSGSSSRVLRHLDVLLYASQEGGRHVFYLSAVRQVLDIIPDRVSGERRSIKPLVHRAVCNYSHLPRLFGLRGCLGLGDKSEADSTGKPSPLLKLALLYRI